DEPCGAGGAFSTAGAFKNCEILSCGLAGGGLAGGGLARLWRGCPPAGVSSTGFSIGGFGAGGFSDGLSCAWKAVTAAWGRAAGTAIISAILGSFAETAGAARANRGAGWRLLCQTSALRRTAAAAAMKKPAASV